jgi:hypothetical protein
VIDESFPVHVEVVLCAGNTVILMISQNISVDVLPASHDNPLTEANIGTHNNWHLREFGIYRGKYFLPADGQITFTLP